MTTWKILIFLLAEFLRQNTGYKVNSYASVGKVFQNKTNKILNELLD